MKKLILALLMCVPVAGWGATYYVNTASSGGDGTTNNTSGATAAYATMAAAVAARCPISENTTFECSGSTDTAAVSITTVGAYTLTIHGDWSDTKFDYAKYHLAVTGASCISISTNNVVLSNLQVQSSNRYTERPIHLTTPSGPGRVVIKNCFIDSGSANAIHFDGLGNSGTHLIYNTIIHKTGEANESGINWYVANFDVSLAMYNVTIIGFTTGVNHGNGNAIKAVNVITNDCTNGFSGSYAAGSDYNASDINSDAPGDHSRNGTNGDITFANTAIRDYGLGASDANAKDYGTSSVDSLFTDDIKGATRSGSWDIGAHEYGATSGGGTPPAYPQILIFE